MRVQRPDQTIVLAVEERTLRRLSRRRWLVLAELLEACRVALTGSGEGSPPGLPVQRSTRPVPGAAITTVSDDLA